MSESDLSGIVAARICHDLVSPVGAIGNALDLMDELQGADTTEERALIRSSTTRASAILRLHRLAFGHASGDGAIARDELRERVESVLAGPRVEMQWIGLDGPALDLAAARVVALMAMSARMLLGLRGRITVNLALDGAWPVTVAALGDAAACGTAEEGWLTGTNPMPPEPRQVELALLPGAVASGGAALAIRTAPGSVVLTARRG